jgi:hypothetical protein
MELSAKAEVVNVDLAKEADWVEISITDQIALRHQDLREWMVERVVPAFRWANAATLIAPGVLVVLDEVNIWRHLASPADRVITSQVFMALLGATTVQVGSIAFLIARYLFPGRT